MSYKPSREAWFNYGLCASILTLGPALGPTASGILLQYFSWHSLFIVLVPFLILCIILGSIF
ncbi:MFS transporter, partial [Clostridium acetobutylicum]|uniref:MFS transporter n=1 Tax=Clostridium acetobutylicum TaxID=1488 RepID=UPI0030FE8F5E